MKHQYGTKSTFVRLNPSLAAKDVVKLAKTQGIKLSLSYVYGVRCAARKTRLFGIFDAAPKVSATSGRAIAAMHTPNESKLRQLIGELGLIRSRGIVDEMARRVGHFG